MDFENPESLDLTGSLLLAAPCLQDPNFRKSVLLLVSHSQNEGAHGFVLNQPIGKTVGEIVTNTELSPLSEIPVFIGGPVSKEQLTFSSFYWNPNVPGQLDCESHLSFHEASRRMEEGFVVRAFVGYSGWSEGQLENELLHEAWFPRQPDKIIDDLEISDGMWNDLMRSMGPYHRLMADSPDDPSLN